MSMPDAATKETTTNPPITDPLADRVRGSFPVLSEPMRGKPLVYLDNGATSLKPHSVIEAELEYYRRNSSNIHRGVYEFSERATAAYDAARSEVASFIHAAADHEIIFTRGTTESINLVAYSWARNTLSPGDEIVTTELEHHSNLVVWQQAAKATGATLKFLPLMDDSSGLVSEGIAQTIGASTKLVAITGMSNVTGYMPPLSAIIERAHEVGALVLVDGAQLVAHHPV
ncbi:MAG: aminotransferase class V-fold PLP-dependent enzyme, partial [Spirochaetia bacterium]